MKIYGLEKLSLVDFGSYAAAVVFTGGCNFRCPYCHNAGLATCQVETLDNNEVMEYLKSRKKLLDGVVVSGGEPTLNADLIDFLKELKAMGYKVKLDTNGTNPIMLKEIIDKNLVDYVAMDIKNSLNSYAETIGIQNYNTSKIEESIKILKQNKVDYEFRTTLVLGLHTLESITKMAEELKGAKRLFLQHFVDNGGCLKSGLQEIPKASAEEFKKVLTGYGIDTKLRGYI